MIWVIDLSCEIQTVTRCTACRWVKYLHYLGISRYSSWLSLQTYFFWKLSISLIAIIFCVHLVSDLRKGVSVYKYLNMKVKGNTKHFSADLEKYNWHRSLHRIPIYISGVGLKDKEKKDKENEIFNLETLSYVLTWQVFILHI